MKKFCIEPFENLYIEESGTVKIAPCCIAKTREATSTNLFHDDYLKEIRASFLNNEEHEACNACWDAEKAGLPSRRTSQVNNATNNTQLRRLDYWTGNLCNLRCVICSPHSSSSWKKDAKHFDLDVPEYKSVNAWQKINFDDLVWIHLNGGEPLMNQSNKDFLKSIKSPQNVDLYYNTNGVTYPDEVTLDLWKNFNLVSLIYSIDDIRDRFEYQRYPGKWDKLEKTIFSLRDNNLYNLYFGLNVTVSMLNVFYLQELYDWVDENFATNQHGNPNYIETQQAHGVCQLSLTDKMKQYITEKTSTEVLSKINFTDEYDPEKFISFFKYIEKLDQIRNVKFSDAHSEWYTILKEEYDRVCIR